MRTLTIVLLLTAHYARSQVDSSYLRWPIVFEGRVATIEKLKTYSYLTADHQRKISKHSHHPHYLISFTETRVLKKDYQFDDQLQEFSTDSAYGGFKFRASHKYLVYATMVDGMPYPVKVTEIEK